MVIRCIIIVAIYKPIGLYGNPVWILDFNPFIIDAQIEILTWNGFERKFMSIIKCMIAHMSYGRMRGV